jgi:hypothetical protein
MGLTSGIRFVDSGIRSMKQVLGTLQVPVGIGLGLLTLAYSAVLRRMSGGRVRDVPAPLRITIRVTYLAVLALMLLWLAGNLAQERGAYEAEKHRRTITVFLAAVVYSPERLHLEGAGMTETRLPGENAKVRYRYEGLRLVAHSHGVYVLLPQCWAQTPGARAIILHDEESLRLEFSPVEELPIEELPNCPSPPVTGKPGAGPGG